MKAWWLIALACACTEPAGELVDVTRGDLVLAVDVTGQLAAADSTDIKTPTISGFGDSYALTEVALEGTEVKVGDALATLDPSALARELDSLRFQVTQTQTFVDARRVQSAATRRFEALVQLQAEGIAWRTATAIQVPVDLVGTLEMRNLELEDEEAKLGLQQVKLDAAEAQRADAMAIERLLDDRANAQRRFDELTRNLQRLTLTSPRAGTVIYVPGRDPLKVGVSVNDTFMTVVGLGSMIGDGAVDEVDIARIALHQPVMLRVDALADVQLHGTVAEIAASVLGDTIHTVKLEIAIDAAKTVPLRPGMRFRGQVETERLHDVLQIPAEAVFVTPDGPVAYRETRAGLERVPLELGRSSTESIEVKSGLAAGDRISRVAP